MNYHTLVIIDLIGETAFNKFNTETPRIGALINAMHRAHIIGANELE